MKKRRRDIKIEDILDVVLVGFLMLWNNLFNPKIFWVNINHSAFDFAVGTFR